VTGVEDRGEKIVVTRKGKPAAVLVNCAEYERLKETIDVLSDPELMRQITLSRKFYARGRQGLSLEDVFGERLVPAKPRTRVRPWRVEIPPHVAEVIRHLPPELKREVRAALRAIATDPATGEPLRKELDGLWKFRVRRYRLVYAVDRVCVSGAPHSGHVGTSGASSSTG
jgi:prevent-host-death family protein